MARRRIRHLDIPPEDLLPIFGDTTIYDDDFTKKPSDVHYDPNYGAYVGINPKTGNLSKWTSYHGALKPATVEATLPADYGTPEQQNRLRRLEQKAQEEAIQEFRAQHPITDGGAQPVIGPLEAAVMGGIALSRLGTSTLAEGVRGGINTLDKLGRPSAWGRVPQLGEAGYTTILGGTNVGKAGMALDTAVGVPMIAGAMQEAINNPNVGSIANAALAALPVAGVVGEAANLGRRASDVNDAVRILDQVAGLPASEPNLIPTSTRLSQVPVARERYADAIFNRDNNVSSSNLYDIWHVARQKGYTPEQIGAILESDGIRNLSNRELFETVEALRQQRGIQLNRFGNLDLSSLPDNYRNIQADANNLQATTPNAVETTSNQPSRSLADIISDELGQPEGFTPSGIADYLPSQSPTYDRRFSDIMDGTDSDFNDTSAIWGPWYEALNKGYSPNQIEHMLANGDLVNRSTRELLEAVATLRRNNRNIRPASSTHSINNTVASAPTPTPTPAPTPTVTTSTNSNTPIFDIPVSTRKVRTKIPNASQEAQEYDIDRRRFIDSLFDAVEGKTFRSDTELDNFIDQLKHATYGGERLGFDKLMTIGSFGHSLKSKFKSFQAKYAKQLLDEGKTESEVRDILGKPIEIPKTDRNGNPILDSDGKPVVDVYPAVTDPSVLYDIMHTTGSEFNRSGYGFRYDNSNNSMSGSIIGDDNVDISSASFFDPTSAAELMNSALENMKRGDVISIADHDASLSHQSYPLLLKTLQRYQTRRLQQGKPSFSITIDPNTPYATYNHFSKPNHKGVTFDANRYSNDYRQPLIDDANDTFLDIIKNSINKTNTDAGMVRQLDDAGNPIPLDEEAFRKYISNIPKGSRPAFKVKFLKYGGRSSYPSMLYRNIARRTRFANY